MNYNIKMEVYVEVQADDIDGARVRAEEVYDELGKFESALEADSLGRVYDFVTEGPWLEEE